MMREVPHENLIGVASMVIALHVKKPVGGNDVNAATPVHVDGAGRSEVHVHASATSGADAVTGPGANGSVQTECPGRGPVETESDALVR
jgi:hypothetical protein